MNWLVNFLTSSIGRKAVMSLTGLFLCLYLVIHVGGNLQLFMNDDGAAFNAYADFMVHNPIIGIVAWLTKLTIALHAIQGLLLYFQNRAARGVQYKVKNKKSSSWSSRNMAFLGTVLLVFIVVHLQNFWWKMHYGETPKVDINGHEVTDIYKIVATAFQQEWIVGLYVVSMFALAYHMIHGFNSAFQSLGLNHKKYAQFLKFLSIGVFGIIIPLIFAAMPIYFYLKAGM